MPSRPAFGATRCAFPPPAWQPTRSSCARDLAVPLPLHHNMSGVGTPGGNRSRANDKGRLCQPPYPTLPRQDLLPALAKVNACRRRGVRLVSHQPRPGDAVVGAEVHAVLGREVHSVVARAHQAASCSGFGTTTGRPAWAERPERHDGTTGPRHSRSRRRAKPSTQPIRGPPGVHRYQRPRIWRARRDLGARTTTYPSRTEG